jgi:hypothetical protein
LTVTLRALLSIAVTVTVACVISVFAVVTPPCSVGVVVPVGGESAADADDATSANASTVTPPHPITNLCLNRIVFVIVISFDISPLAEPGRLTAICHRRSPAAGCENGGRPDSR